MFPTRSISCLSPSWGWSDTEEMSCRQDCPYSPSRKVPWASYLWHQSVFRISDISGPGDREGWWRLLAGMPRWSRQGEDRQLSPSTVGSLLCILLQKRLKSDTFRIILRQIRTCFDFVFWSDQPWQYQNQNQKYISIKLIVILTGEYKLTI